MLQELIRKNASTFISLFLLVAVPVLVSSTLAYYLYQYQEVLQSLQPAQTVLYFVVVAFTMAFALTPTTFVALVTGYYFGWPGFLGVVLSYGLAALTGYAVAQIIDHGKMLAFLHRFKKAGAVMDELREQSWGLIILSRISPVLPFAFMTFVLSLLRINRVKFLLASMLGMLPRTLFFFWVGTQAQNIITLLNNPDAGTEGKILVIGLIIISLFGLYYIFNRALKKALTRSTDVKK
ncbi:TVP38/TMEM64 family protein [Adhaeribacter rhizoryzae]|uniref:TVP38/TMEM64 family protein n=1 Tax=Adhaeribacter rhizoryzae TaxID=2607907 RepID=UPI001CC207C5|nr:VTT domain-containing protein [Adhaeribacter rhizoryzae]